MAENFRVRAGMTDNVGKAVMNDDTGVIESGGALIAPMFWSGGIAGQTVVIENSELFRGGLECTRSSCDQQFALVGTFLPHRSGMPTHSA